MWGDATLYLKWKKRRSAPELGPLEQVQLQFAVQLPGFIRFCAKDKHHPPHLI